jgi:hypothetical protein
MGPGFTAYNLDQFKIRLFWVRLIDEVTLKLVVICKKCNCRGTITFFANGQEPTLPRAPL